MTHSSIADATGAWDDAVASRLRDYTCPLYREGQHAPQLVGSGVVLRVGSIVFAATAAHVVEDLGSGPRYIGVLDELLELPPLQYTNRLTTGEQRDRDRVDVGALVFPPHVAQRFNSTTSASVHLLDLEPADAIADRTRHFVYGFPSTRSSTNCIRWYRRA